MLEWLRPELRGGGEVRRRHAYSPSRIDSPRCAPSPSRRAARGRGAPDLEPGHGELLVRVRGAGINGADMLQRRGAYPAPPGAPEDIPGLELAGEVAALGPGASRLRRGRPCDGRGGWRRSGGAGGGTRARGHAGAGRPRLGRGRGLPEVFTTAHDAVFSQAGLLSGEHLLVHGAAGGVGTAAVQLGRAAGARSRHRSPRGAARRGRAARRSRDCSRGLRESGPSRRHPRAGRRLQPRGRTSPRSLSADGSP